MGYTKEQLLARLQELQIDFTKHEHPVVLTVEAQAKHVGHLNGALSKNLFLKDKKHRFYVVSALAKTNVDLKVLSQRLGLGKGGLRMAPEEALGEVLQVPLGCVTPFALVNESARCVSLLLDQGFKSQGCCFFHPLSNDTTIALNARDLDKFLSSIGKQPAYVDLEANPPVGKDQPPDLASLVPSDAIAISGQPDKAAPSQVSDMNHAPVNNKSTGVSAKAVKPSTDVQKKKPSHGVSLSNTFADPEKFVENFIERTSSLVLAEITKEHAKQSSEKLGEEALSDKIMKKLATELRSSATMFKNTAYSEGFSAGSRHQAK
ncbi:prolyl-tRNA synthetase associated domain-containing protein 1 [Capsicum annuum]|uniref:prolyl-tRNA synthetase associated domain-containing protein 1 n=1 Tax=Capsicum annuum TaxID=4072 RepID=UPI001FB1136C|nr:prolyl-tRNA synthetase associated domain-containing protein 1 [Capsicum annuum]